MIWFMALERVTEEPAEISVVEVKLKGFLQVLKGF